MNAATERSTAEISRELRNDPIIKLLVPPGLFCSVPVPTLPKGIPCLVYFYYPVQGDFQKPKTIFPPLLHVMVRKEYGKIVRAISAPFFWPSGQLPNQPLGEYPGKALQGLSLQQMNKVYDEYYELCDRLLKEARSSEIASCPLFARWLKAFDQVREEGLMKYFQAFAGDHIVSSQYVDDKREIAPDQERQPGREHRSANNELGRSVDKPDIGVRTYLETAKKHMAGSGLNDLLPVWREIAARHVHSQFSMAVIGELSRGKSTLINKLLESEILPTGDLPTTAILTKIKYGTRMAALRISPDKSHTEIELTQQSLSQFIADKEGIDPEGVLQVELPNKWLCDNDLVIYDTPGVADPTGTRAAIAIEAITMCDVALVVINATMPCSLNEMEFIRDHVMAKRTPRVAAVISRLDLIPASERVKVIEHIYGKLYESFSTIELWSIHSRQEIAEVDHPCIGAAGPKAIRGKVSEWVSDANIRRLRDLQTLARLRMLLVNALLLLSEQLETAKRSKAEREKYIRTEKQSIERANMDWEEIQIELDKRMLATERMFASVLEGFSPDIIEDLRRSFKRSSNPKLWWEEEFPYYLSKQVKRKYSLLSGKIEEQVANHQAWLERNVHSRFSLRSSGLSQKVEIEGVNLENLGGSKYSGNLERKRIIYRVGALPVTIASFCLFGPYAIGISGALGIWTEVSLKRMIEKEKLASLDMIDKSVDEIFRNLSNNISVCLRKRRQAMFENIRTQATKWQSAKLQALEKAESMTEPEKDILEANISAINNFISELSTIMGDKNEKC